MCSCAPLTPDPDNIILIRTAKDLHLKFGKHLEAVRCAIMLNDPAEIKRIVKSSNDQSVLFSPFSSDFHHLHNAHSL